MASPLAHRSFRADGVTARRHVWLLHGILGSGRNLASVARRLVETLPDQAATIVDLRHHGRSLGHPPPDDLDACAADLDALAEAVGHRPDALIGHSFGGKVALAWTERHPEHPVRVSMIDSPPSARPDAMTAPVEAGDGGRAEHGLLRRTPGPFADRDRAVEALTAGGLTEGTAAWLSSSLVRAGQGLVWGFELPRIEALIADYFRREHWPWIEAVVPHRHVQLVVGGRSDRFTADEREHAETLARVGAIRLDRLPEAGHWVHVDDPDGLHEALVSFLR